MARQQSDVLSQAEAEELLKIAESQDGFFAKVKGSAVNRLARVRCTYQAWNDQSLAVKAKALLDPEDRDAVNIIILDPSAEGGMPHTRPGIICLPAHYPESKLKETLEHEMIHISQKRQATLWASRASIEGWEPVRPGLIPDFWASRLRLNPDTFNTLYAWKGLASTGLASTGPRVQGPRVQGRYVPLPVFIREDKPNMREIEVRWLDVAEGIVKTSPPTSFTQVYGTLGAVQAEHPYELWAYSK